jgi:hypothetical protein
VHYFNVTNVDLFGKIGWSIPKIPRWGTLGLNIWGAGTILGGSRFCNFTILGV